MVGPVTGGCACGAVRYTFEGEPFVSYACHCTDCQKRTSGAFGVSIRAPAESVRIDKGEMRSYSRVADSGNQIDVGFCGDCGTSLFGGSLARPEAVVIFAGTLDDPSWVPIQANIWARSAMPWVRMDPDVERFETLPDFAKYYENR